LRGLDKRRRAGAHICEHIIPALDSKRRGRCEWRQRQQHQKRRKRFGVFEQGPARCKRHASLRFVGLFFLRCLSLIIKDVDALHFAACVLHYSFCVLVSLGVAGTLGLHTKPMLSLLSVALIMLGFAIKDLLVTALGAGIKIRRLKMRKEREGKEKSPKTGSLGLTVPTFQI
jgi:hypothetical protein